MGAGDAVRLAEAFGPTIQGEGPYAGRVAHFLRLGGCDYRCDWCDSMHAVDPASVRAMDDMAAGDVAAILAGLPTAPMLVITGGNPVLWDLGELIDLLLYDVIAVETQGSMWRPWLDKVQSLVVSPKPPSSGMAERHAADLDNFMAHAGHHPGLALKVVCFDDADVAWAADVHGAYAVPFFLSVGTRPDDEPGDVGARYAWLCDHVTADPRLHASTVLPQLHVVAWGHKVGV
jgi:7-carboxy-7-deazaguanine synthase